MPAYRAGRASKACSSCRKQKTRCHSSRTSISCLRCNTLQLECSLAQESSPACDAHDALTPGQAHFEASTSTTIDARLGRLESMLERLVKTLESESRIPGLPSPPHTAKWSCEVSGLEPKHAQPSKDEPRLAPMFLIRDAAMESKASVSPSPPGMSLAYPRGDVISNGLITEEFASSLVELFQRHYGRWIRLPQDDPDHGHLWPVRGSPLLLCCILLIAVRHSTDSMAERLAPRLLDEASRLLASELLIVPQSKEFFQASIILGLWPTSVGEAPLSIDSWAVTGYALQQALASPLFANATQESSSDASLESQRGMQFLWNHLALAHLQACVGMQRPSMITAAQIQRCIELASTDTDRSHEWYESRMAAEVHLYWIIYKQCCQTQDADLEATKHAFSQWQRTWTRLFAESRSQFLHLNMHFAQLFAHYQWLKPRSSETDLPCILEMIQLSKKIIELAMDTADERTRYLTDHIYHVIAFSALLLCQLILKNETLLQSSDCDVAAASATIARLLDWFMSLNLRGHTAVLLANTILVQYQKLCSSSLAFSPTTLDINSAMYSRLSSSLDGEYTDQYGIADLYSNILDVDLLSFPDGTF